MLRVDNSVSNNMIKQLKISKNFIQDTYELQGIQKKKLFFV
jgi:hypothetical protein